MPASPRVAFVPHWEHSGDDRGDRDGFADGMRRLGRALGEVRDLDVAAKLLKEIVWQLPSAARAVISLRQGVTQERAGLRRELIKTVERHPLDELVPTAVHRPRQRWPRGSASTERNLRSRIHEHSVKLTTAIEHAAGVYFPNRLHNVRIRAKRLRYLVEVAERTGRMRPERELAVLKRAQSVLGNLHDREWLIQRLAQSGEEHGETDVLRGRLTEERDALFQDYLSRRNQLLEVSEQIRSQTAERGRRWVPVAAMLAVPSALVIGLVGRANSKSAKPQQSHARHFDDRPATRA